MKIRDYKSDDKSGLTALLIYLQNYQKNFEPDVLSEGENISDDFLSLIIEDSSKKYGKILVAEDQGKIIGFVSGNTEKGPGEIELQEKKYFYISNVAVLPDYQKQGIGKKLLTEIENFAKKIGIKIILMNVLAKNSHAYDVYKKLGYRDYEKVLIKAI